MTNKCFLNALFLTGLLSVELYAREDSLSPFQTLLQESTAFDELLSEEEDGILSEAEVHDSIQPTPNCGHRSQPIRLGLSHIEGNGVGYNQGYTTLEGFCAPAEPWGGSWVPFLDVRGHAFNGGKLAANAGTGVRYLTHSRIWGVNAWYDYRRTSAQHYNQVSLGLESLGHIWDFRLNGYLPVGNKTSALLHTKFSAFKNHYMILSSKRECAMKGLNAEVGAHVDNIRNFPFYFAAGPYYLEGKGRRAWGGEVRAALEIFNYIRLEGNTSYDNVFKWIGQGQLSLVIPLGGKKIIKESSQRSCAQELTLANRSVQRVERNEIIPVHRDRIKAKAINPLTEEPYFFWFVDNTSHSQGTYESPFNTLVAAQDASAPHDVIYVFPGDGTTAGMNLGIALQDNQRFFGASVTHSLPTTVGSIQIPSLAYQLPVIENIVSLPATITLQNNNEVSGFSIKNINTNNIISQSLSLPILSNLSVTQNVLPEVTATGIYLSNASGKITISNNTISSDENAITLNSSNSQNVSFSIVNNTLSSASGAAISMTLNTVLNPSLSIENNTMSSKADIAMSIALNTASNPSLSIKNNAISIEETIAMSIALNTASNPFLSIANNTMMGPGVNSMLLTATSCTNGDLSIENNTLTDATSYGAALLLTDCSNHSLLIKDNEINTASGGGIHATLTNSSADLTNTLTIQDNTIASQGYSINLLLTEDATANINLKNNTAVSSSSSGIVLTADNQSQSTVSIVSNRLTSSSDAPLSLTFNNNSQAAITVDDNTLTSHATSNLFLNNASQLSGSFTNNQMTSDNEGGLFLLTDANTPSTSLLISDNTFTGGGVGFEATVSSKGQTNISILNNQFVNAVDDGLVLSPQAASLSSWIISGNTFTGSGTHALDYAAAGTATSCLKLTSNTASPTSNAYIIHNGSSGTLSLEPVEGNVGDVVSSGTISNIPAGGCSQ